MKVVFRTRNPFLGLSLIKDWKRRLRRFFGDGPTTSEIRIRIDRAFAR